MTNTQENIIQTEFFITKATLDEKTGKMIWAATASDTDPDSYAEKMSLELYESFIDRIDSENPPYVSLAHYGRLGGKGEAGVATDVYIQGKQLKAKGYFHDNPLGTAIFNAIRQDRRINRSQEERIRISIGFYDRKHSHANGTVWEFKSGVPCTQCALGIGGKTYLDGILEHLAVTRVPVNKRTDITAKSESEDMPTRKEDALSIVENEEIVNEIDKAHQETLRAKSETETGLIERAGDNVGLVSTISQLDNQKLLQLFKKMNPDGEITEDEVSKLVNDILNETTDRSTVEKSDDYKPFGGATSFAEGKEYLQASQLENNAYRAYSMFGAFASNILTAEEGTITDKLSAMQTLLSEFKEHLNPKKLMELSEAEDKPVESTQETSAPEVEIKADTVADSPFDIKPLENRMTAIEKKLEELSIQQPASVEIEAPKVENSNPVIQSVVEDFSTNLSAAVALSGVERQAALQEVINRAGAKLLEVDRSLTATETSTPQTNQPSTVDLETAVSRAVDEKIAPVTMALAQLGNQLNDLQSVLKGQQIHQSIPARAPIEVPQMKSIALPGPGMAPAKSAEGLSIMDIATRTTFGSGR